MDDKDVMKLWALLQCAREIQGHPQLPLLRGQIAKELQELEDALSPESKAVPEAEGPKAIPSTASAGSAGNGNGDAHTGRRV